MLDQVSHLTQTIHDVFKGSRQALGTHHIIPELLHQLTVLPYSSGGLFALVSVQIIPFIASETVLLTGVHQAILYLVPGVLLAEVLVVHEHSLLALQTG